MNSHFFLTCLFSLLGCAGFCLIYNLRGKIILAAAIGGAVGWAAYLLGGPLHNDLLQFFLATVVITAYSEIMARIFKAPVTAFLIVALLPLVPGSGIYYTMNYFITGDKQNFLQTGWHTLAIAGSLAIGIFPVATFVRLFHRIRAMKKQSGKPEPGFSAVRSGFIPPESRDAGNLRSEEDQRDIK